VLCKGRSHLKRVGGAYRGKKGDPKTSRNNRASSSTSPTMWGGGKNPPDVFEEKEPRAVREKKYGEREKRRVSRVEKRVTARRRGGVDLWEEKGAGPAIGRDGDLSKGGKTPASKKRGLPKKKNSKNTSPRQQGQRSCAPKEKSRGLPRGEEKGEGSAICPRTEEGGGGFKGTDRSRVPKKRVGDVIFWTREGRHHIKRASLG